MSSRPARPARPVRTAHALALATLLFGLHTGPALADSLSISASSGASTSVGSLSTSIEKSSTSSSGGDRVADGDYRIIEMAEVPGQPGRLRLTLQAVDAAAGAGFALLLPAETAERNGLAAGRQISVRQRPYGLAFAQGEPREAFFLVLHDEAFNDLRTVPVTL